MPQGRPFAPAIDLHIHAPPGYGLSIYRLRGSSLRVLAIESSGRVGSVALLDTAQAKPASVLERTTPEGERTAQSLLPTIEALLRERSWRPADVELVCVTTGPGSFTGLRIGIVTAKTFAYATGAKLVGVHTLAAIAAGIEWPAGRLWTILDAQRQELFASSFVAGHSLPDLPRPATEILGIAQWLNRLEPGDYIAGPPLSKLRIQLPAAVTVIDESLWHPKAAVVGRLGLQLFERGKIKNPLELVPRYYRKSAAEEKAARLSS
jgi:tRNA threonylcarbamoyladenosine biosynthesis protein TsaB